MGANSELARKWFGAVEAGDNSVFTEIAAPEFELRQNGGEPGGLEAAVGLVGAIKGALPDFHYEEIVCVETDDGFVEEHDAVCTLPDGSEFRGRACVVATVSDGKIATFNEYFDSAAAAPVFAALGG